MGRQIRHAVIVAGATLLVALIYVDFPGAPGSETVARGSVASTSPTIQLKGQTIQVTIADTPEKRMQGLSGHAELAENEGMLFVFAEDGRYSFWMKDMKFSIDVLWISADGTIVDIAQNVSPDTYPASYTSKADARYVLELRAGWVQARNVSIGDRVGI